MKIPVAPPDTREVMKQLLEDDVAKYFSIIATPKPTDSKGRYLHWDKLRHQTPPEGFSPEEWWTGIKWARKSLYKEINLLRDKKNKPFTFAIPDCVQRDLHFLDINTAGKMSMETPIVNPHMKNTYLIRSFIDEAINSSQLEGAVTTLNVAKEMLRQGRKPKDKSEQMIFNNYLAMQFIRELKGESLTPSIILELHKIITDQTLNNPEFAGKYRMPEDDIQIVDSRDATLLHEPPNADELPERMERLCKFANDSGLGNFIHPVIRAIILHFMLAYDHPFLDGNGRTARALFYWSVVNQGYWVMEFFSISRILKQAPAQYGRAFLFTESDDNDLTYFIIHQLGVLKKANEELWRYLDKKSEEIREAEKLLESAARLRERLNYRQLSLLRHALKHPGGVYLIQEHQRTHGISYETARKDLLNMADELNLLNKLKEGKAFVFTAPNNLNERIDKAKRE